MPASHTRWATVPPDPSTPRTGLPTHATAAPAGPRAGRTRTAVLLVLTMLASMLTAATPAQAAPAVRVTNPLVAQRADPHIVRHTDGYYYMTATAPEYDRIVLRRATTLQGLSTAPETVIWRRHASGIMGAHIWAPEIHFIDGRWYVYFAAGATDNVWAIRMYVLEGTGANPLTASWAEKGQIRTPWETFALDASTFVTNGVRYLIWAQGEPGIATNSNLYIARMANPWTHHRHADPDRRADPGVGDARRGQGQRGADRASNATAGSSSPTRPAPPTPTTASACSPRRPARPAQRVVLGEVAATRSSPATPRPASRARGTTRSPSPRTGSATSSSTTTATTGTSAATR